MGAAPAESFCFCAICGEASELDREGTAVIGWPPAPGERIEVHWELNDDEGGSTRTRSVWWGCVVVGPTAGGVQLMYEEAHGFSAEAAVVRFQSAAELVDLSSGDTQKWRRRN